MVSENLADRESYRSRYFDSVVRAYSDILERPALVAVRYDEMTPPNPRLSAQDIEFKVDVERATHAALDAVNLFPLWEAMLRGEPVPIHKRAKVTDRCARLYIRRELMPYLYFRPKRLRMHRSERRTAA